MIDDIEGRIWAEHGRSFTDWAAGAVAVIRVSLDRLHHEQFHAPWRDEPRQCGPRG